MSLKPKTKIVEFEKSETLYCAGKLRSGECCGAEVAVTLPGYGIECNGELLGVTIECPRCECGQFQLVTMASEEKIRELATKLGLTDESTSLPPHEDYGLFSKVRLEPRLRAVPQVAAEPVRLPLRHIGKKPDAAADGAQGKVIEFRIAVQRKKPR